MNKYTLSYRFLYGNVHGCVFAKNRPVSLNWPDYTRECEQHKRRSVCASAQSHQHPCCSLSRKHIGLVETKPCFGVPIKRDLYQSPQLLRLATKIEISLVANLDIIVSTKRLKAKALIRLVYAFVVRKPPKTGFLTSRPILCQPAT